MRGSVGPVARKVQGQKLGLSFPTAMFGSYLSFHDLSQSCTPTTENLGLVWHASLLIQEYRFINILHMLGCPGRFLTNKRGDSFFTSIAPGGLLSCAKVKSQLNSMWLCTFTRLTILDTYGKVEALRIRLLTQVRGSFSTTDEFLKVSWLALRPSLYLFSFHRHDICMFVSFFFICFKLL